MSYDKQTGAAKSMLYMNKWDKESHLAKKAWDLWNFEFTAAPKKGTTMSHKRNIQHEWAETDDKSAYVTKEKTTSALGMQHDDVSVNMEADNGQWKLKLAKPLVKDDWKINGSFTLTGKPAKSLTGEANFIVDSPDMSGTKLNMNITAKQEQAYNKGEAAKAATNLAPAKNAVAEGWYMGEPDCKVHMNANIEKDMNVGAQFQYKGKLTGCEFGASYNDDGNVYWMGYDHTALFAKAGCLIDYKAKSFKHAYEARWFMDENKAGNKRDLFHGMPLKWVASGAYTMSDKSSMGYMFEMGKDAHLMAQFTHKLDKNWKVSARQSYDMGIKDSKAYQLGMDITYAL